MTATEIDLIELKEDIKTGDFLCQYGKVRNVLKLEGKPYVSFVLVKGKTHVVFNKEEHPILVWNGEDPEKDEFCFVSSKIPKEGKRYFFKALKLTYPIGTHECRNDYIEGVTKLWNDLYLARSSYGEANYYIIVR